MNLTDLITQKYKKTFWIKNYVKTVTASTLIASGVGLIITGELTRMQTQGWSDAELILGISCVFLALLVTFILDYYAAQKDKEMIKDITEYIDERAEEIAKNKIVEAMEKME